MAKTKNKAAKKAPKKSTKRAPKIIDPDLHVLPEEIVRAGSVATKSVNFSKAVTSPPTEENPLVARIDELSRRISEGERVNKEALSLVKVALNILKIR